MHEILTQPAVHLFTKVVLTGNAVGLTRVRKRVYISPRVW